MQVKHHFFFLTNSRVCIERPSDVVIGIMIAECMCSDVCKQGYCIWPCWWECKQVTRYLDSVLMWRESMCTYAQWWVGRILCRTGNGYVLSEVFDQKCMKAESHLPSITKKATSQEIEILPTILLSANRCQVETFENKIVRQKHQQHTSAIKPT